MLVFEVVKDGKAVQIYFDDAGIKILSDAIEKVRSKAGHMHLYSPMYGGHALDQHDPWGGRGVDEVILDDLNEGDE